MSKPGLNKQVFTIDTTKFGDYRNDFYFVFDGEPKPDGEGFSYPIRKVPKPSNLENVIEIQFEEDDCV